MASSHPSPGESDGEARPPREEFAVPELASGDPERPGVPPALQTKVDAKSLIGGAAGYTVAMLVNAAAGLIGIKIALAHLGVEWYGVLLLSGTVSSWGVLGTFGLSSAIRQRMTSQLAVGKVEEAARCLSSGIGALAAIAVGLLAVFLVVHGTGGTEALLKDAPDLERAVRVLLIAVLLYLLKFPFIPIGAVVLARNQVLAHNLFSILYSATRPLVLWLTLRQTTALEVLLIVQSAHQWLDLVLRYAVARRSAPGLRVRPSLASRSTARSLVAPSLSYLVISVGMVVIYSTSNAVISGVLGVAYIAGFAAAFRLFDILRNICVSGIEVLFPAAAILDATGERARLREYVVIASRFALALAVLGGAGLAYLGGPVIDLWLGEDLLHPPSPATLLALGALLPVGVFINAMGRAVTGVGRHHRQALIFVVEIIANLGLTIGLAHSLGVLGVALGTLGARLLVTPLYFVDSVRTLGLGAGDVLRRALLPSVAIAAPLAAVAETWPVPDGIRAGELAAVIGVYAIVCAAALWLITPAAIRAKLVGRLSRRGRR